ncbi:MAG: DMT family transporter [Clostridiales bacterium]|nr:DMT family transporter [Clostridiales bacterium]
MNPRLKGSLLVALSGISWSFSGVLGKSLAWSSLSKAGVRSVVAVLLFALVRKGFRLRLTKSTLIGGLGVALTSLLYLTALSLTTSANAITLQYSMPVYVALFDFLLFRKKPSLKQLVLLPLLLAGVALCCAGDSVGEPLRYAYLGNIAALLSAVSFSVVFLASRIENCSTTDYTYFGNLITLLLIAFLPFDPSVRFGLDAVALTDWLRAGLMGASLGLGYIFLALGLKTASPLDAAVLENLEPALNPVWVFLFIGERPDLTGILGCGLILLSVILFALLPEARKRQEATKLKKEKT